MVSTDYPFSITSKFQGPGGAEHLVTVRAPTAEQFRQRLTEAATIFPYAGFGQAQAQPATQETASQFKARNNAEGAVKAAKQTVAAIGAAVAGQDYVDGQDGNKLCPQHLLGLQGKYGLYCPFKTDPENGGYCSWTWPPRRKNGATPVPVQAEA